MQINKDTRLYGSFSSSPGNNGCIYFNTRFKQEKVNAIYKSFYGIEPAEIMQAARVLDFKGFGVSMPLKQSIIPFLDNIDKHAGSIVAVNTIVKQQDKYTGYNTDWIGVQNFLLSHNIDSVSIIGNGGFSRAIQYCCIVNRLEYEVFTRENINLLSKASYTVFNATPENFSCDIDGRPNTETGKEIAFLQAEEQYKLYEKNY